jgi:hypothetical protein
VEATRIETLDNAGSTQKYSSVMEALAAAERDAQIRALMVRCASGEWVKLERPTPRHSFQLTYVDGAERRRDEGFEVQTRDTDGALHYFTTVTEAITVARRRMTIWKVSFPGPAGQRIRLVRDYATSMGPSTSPFVLDMMEVHLEEVRRRHGKGGRW